MLCITSRLIHSGFLHSLLPPVMVRAEGRLSTGLREVEKGHWGIQGRREEAGSTADLALELSGGNTEPGLEGTMEGTDIGITEGFGYVGDGQVSCHQQLQYPLLEQAFLEFAKAGALIIEMALQGTPGHPHRCGDGIYVRLHQLRAVHMVLDLIEKSLACVLRTQQTFGVSQRQLIQMLVAPGYRLVHAFARQFQDVEFASGLYRALQQSGYPLGIKTRRQAKCSPDPARRDRTQGFQSGSDNG